MFPQCSHNGEAANPKMRSWGCHLTRKRGVYYYRRRVPGRGNRELTISLRTRCYRKAEFLAENADRVFAKAAASMVTLEELQKIVATYIQQELNDDLVWYHKLPEGESIDEYCDLPYMYRLLKRARDNLRKRDLSWEKDLIDEIMGQHQIPEDLRMSVGHYLLRARVELFEKFIQRQKGHFEPIEADRPMEKPKPVPTGPKLSTLLPEFLDYMTTEKGWRGQTLAQNSTTYAMFIDVCGDKPIGDYCRDDTSMFYELLRKLPKFYSKDAVYKGLKLTDIPSRATTGTPRLSMKTIKRHFSALGVLFDYYKRHGKFREENPAHGFEYPNARRKQEGRQMWEGEKLKKLFSSPVWTGCESASQRSKSGNIVLRDEKYWLPVLGLYHGNRLEEFAQLRKEDIVFDDGAKLYYFNITDEGDRQTKNKNANRRVPLHPAVIDLGFVNWLEEQNLQPSMLVFQALKPGGPDKKLGFYFTKWFTRYRRTIGVYEAGLDYHSFRHGVTTMLYAAGVAREVIDELVGHEGVGTSQVVYKKKNKMPLSLLHEAITKVAWPEVPLMAVAGASSEPCAAGKVGKVHCEDAKAHQPMRIS